MTRADVWSAGFEAGVRDAYLPNQTGRLCVSLVIVSSEEDCSMQSSDRV